MTPEEEVRRAAAAQQILNDPLVRSALDDIRATLIDQWYRSPVKDSELRDSLWALYCGAVKFEEVLRSHIETGKIASAQLDQRSVTGGRPTY